jgi:hypothetical protein
MIGMPLTYNGPSASVVIKAAREDALPTEPLPSRLDYYIQKDTACPACSPDTEGLSVSASDTLAAVSMCRAVSRPTAGRAAALC